MHVDNDRASKLWPYLFPWDMELFITAGHTPLHLAGNNMIKPWEEIEKKNTLSLARHTERQGWERANWMKRFL